MSTGQFLTVTCVASTVSAFVAAWLALMF